MTAIKMNVHQKLIEVKKEAGGFFKDADTTSQFNPRGYKYVTGSQVLSKITDKMNEIGLLLIPKLGLEPKLTSFQITTKKGDVKDQYLYDNTMTYFWVNADEPTDFIEIPWSLTGIQDDPSKAFGSALTYSERYVLLKSLGLPTDDDNPENLDGDRGERTPKEKAPYKAPYTPSDTITTAQANRAVAMSYNKKDLTPEIVKKTSMKQFDKPLESLNKTEYEKLIAWIEKHEDKVKKEGE